MQSVLQYRYCINMHTVNRYYVFLLVAMSKKVNFTPVIVIIHILDIMTNALYRRIAQKLKTINNIIKYRLRDDCHKRKYDTQMYLFLKLYTSVEKQSFANKFRLKHKTSFKFQTF